MEGAPSLRSCYPPAMKSAKRKTPFPTPEESIARYALMDNVVRNFKGQIDELESALGMYVIAQHYGWKVLYLVHTKRTIRKYEEILGVRLAEICDPVGPDAEHTVAHKIISTASNFWRAVSGEEKSDIPREKRRSVE